MNMKKYIIAVLGVFAFIFAYAAYTLFPKAFPILNINLEMSREEAFQKSTEMSKVFNIGPQNPLQAATFNTDEEAQNFIELAQGGRERLIESGIYGGCTFYDCGLKAI